VPLPVSHAFHTSIVAPASKPLREMLSHLRMRSPRVPIVANFNGEFYPTGPDVVPQMLDLLSKQVASPVQFVKGLRTLYDAGARVQELIDLSVGDVRLDPPAQLRLLGKGRKMRAVPLMDNTVQLLRDHLQENHLDRPEQFDKPLLSVTVRS